MVSQLKLSANAEKQEAPHSMFQHGTDDLKFEPLPQESQEVDEVVLKLINLLPAVTNHLKAECRLECSPRPLG